jgi:hypothetical protein
MGDGISRHLLSDLLVGGLQTYCMSLPNIHKILARCQYIVLAILIFIIIVFLHGPAGDGGQKKKPGEPGHFKGLDQLSAASTAGGLASDRLCQM